MLVKVFIFVLYCTLILLGGFNLKGRKFGDLTPICQIHQSFWFYGSICSYTETNYSINYPHVACNTVTQFSLVTSIVIQS